MHLSWKSRYLSIPNLDISLANPYTLITPASFTFSFNPVIVKADLVEGVIENLSIPVDDIKNSYLHAKLKTKWIAMEDPLPMNLSPLDINLMVKTFDQIELDLNSVSLKASLLCSFDMSKLTCKGHLSCAEAILEAQKKRITLKNTSVPFQWDGKMKTAAIQISSQVQNPTDLAGSIEGQLNLSNFSTDKGIDFNRATIHGMLDLQDISSTLLDTLI